ncbi:hypothetical protein [Burkholderia cenocepacia]|uniref:hypothetical protein n=1 Tax=Burkholderia cenocepacia TaxID=95486 RepID=UPI0011777FB5|nr:hypothetical protein [Burkholderia cenocepacia]
MKGLFNKLYELYWDRRDINEERAEFFEACSKLDIATCKKFLEPNNYRHELLRDFPVDILFNIVVNTATKDPNYLFWYKLVWNVLKFNDIPQNQVIFNFTRQGNPHLPQNHL